MARIAGKKHEANKREGEQKRLEKMASPWPRFRDSIDQHNGKRDRRVCRCAVFLFTSNVCITNDVDELSILYDAGFYLSRNPAFSPSLF